jgi:hypothetical protein
MLWSQFFAILAIFGEKIGVFLKNQCYDQFFFQKIRVVWAKNANIFAKFFGENIFKIITSVPDPETITLGLLFSNKTNSIFAEYGQNSLA